MARVFSTEDGNLQTASILTSRVINYSDIDLTFAKKSNNDVFKKNDAAAVKQAVKNLLLTNVGEKPFEPTFGGNLNNFLFDLHTEYDNQDVEDAVAEAISNHEPRAILRNVIADVDPDGNRVKVKIRFQVINVPETQEVLIDLTRAR